MKTMWKTLSVVIAVFAIGALGYLSIGSADEPPPVPPPQSIEEKILGAKAPADHEAIAAYYDQEAKNAHEKHTTHQKMEEYYKKNPALNKSGFSTHCDIIAANYDKTAKEYEALAKLHRDMVKSTK